MKILIASLYPNISFRTDSPSASMIFLAKRASGSLPVLP